ncbi:MAG TPA: C4-type zinc ribbon domain-containing protein [Propionibacteriaceae bacterium]|nr:C4-type zinc ribbon domain-containing protein [Propionibacteriaceae bacterium]
MKADPGAQRRLLELQAVDTAIGQLDHRVKILPEHALLAERQTRRQALGQRLVAAETALSDATAAQTKAEADLVPVRERLLRDERAIEGGTITDPKTLKSMVDEIAHLTTRISTLEDEELELMEAVESAQAELTRIQAERTSIEDEMRALMAKRDAAVADLKADLADRRSVRSSLLAELPPALVDSYEKVRARSGGVGAAALQGRRCTGCGIEANPSDYERYLATPPDEVLRCEECDRILVRTAD